VNASVVDPRMRSRPNRVFARAAVIASVIAIAMLGNLRLHASEATRSPLVGDAGRKPSRIQDVASRRQAVVAEGDASPDDATSGGDAAEDGHFVPAIYAWDPDVRFVYYRHVSKWM